LRTVERDVAAIRAETDQIHEVIVEGRGWRSAMRSVGHVFMVAIGGPAGAVAHKVLNT
jgi:hypothetical protein